MEKIKVEIMQKKEKYEITLGFSLSAHLIGVVKKKFSNNKVVVITEENVLSKCSAFLKDISDLNPLVLSVPQGEESKSEEQKNEIEKKMFENKIGKDSLIISFGGGVICDLAGFIASTYCRGIPIIHVPTSLLAMCDASIGGKTGINTKFGKNLIGTIYQPAEIVVSLDLLDTLPEEEYTSGLAEIIKIACGLDSELFAFMEKNSHEIKNKEKIATSHIIKRAIELKRDIVEKDSYERGIRQILNLGHTIGHSVEIESGYKLKHGFCVAIGIAAESKIAVLENILNEKERRRIVSLLEKYGLPVKVPGSISIEKIIERMSLDKKTKNSIPRFVMLEKIGKAKSDDAIFSFPAKNDNIRKAVGECR